MGKIGICRAYRQWRKLVVNGNVVIIKLKANLSSTGTGLPTGTELIKKENSGSMEKRGNYF